MEEIVLQKLDILNTFQNKNDIRNKNILICFSGGVDSSALIILIKKNLTHPFLKEKKIFIVCFSHNSIEDKDIFYHVKIILKEINLEHFLFCIRLNIDSNQNSIKENYFRKKRLEVILKLCFEYNINYVFTGHQLDDIQEMFLMRCIKNSNIFGLNLYHFISVNPQGVIFVKILNEVSKKHLKLFVLNVLSKKRLFFDKQNNNMLIERVFIRNYFSRIEKTTKKISLISSIKEIYDTCEYLYSKNLKEGVFLHVKEGFLINIDKFFLLPFGIKFFLFQKLLKPFKNSKYFLRRKTFNNILNFMENINKTKEEFCNCCFIKLAKDSNLCVIEEEYFLMNVLSEKINYSQSLIVHNNVKFDQNKNFFQTFQNFLFIRNKKGVFKLLFLKPNTSFSLFLFNTIINLENLQNIELLITIELYTKNSATIKINSNFHNLRYRIKYNSMLL